jgi:hypothetical protein
MVRCKRLIIGLRRENFHPLSGKCKTGKLAGEERDSFLAVAGVDLSADAWPKADDPGHS